jgi:3-deoxy-D-manno-octulosonic-acid transferase
MSKPSIRLRLYQSLSNVGHAIMPLVAPFSAKLREGLDGRRGLIERLAAAADRMQGCIWFHVTSVGEYEQARPIIEALRRQNRSSPHRIAVTHFSPSGFNYAQERPCADLHDYLPFDRRADMQAVMQAWRPKALVFVKYDCWPNQIMAAVSCGVPIILLAGTLQPRSARLWPPARPLFRDLFNSFEQLGVCTEEDRDRFVNGLGVRKPVTVTGDTRAEQVILRYEAAADDRVATRLKQLGGRLLILGSTWPPDERIWLPTLPALLKRFDDLRVVLTPHEPLPDRLERLERDLQHRDIATIRLSILLAGDSVGPVRERCIVVDSVGVLAEIYRAGCLAYRMPVLFGPVIQNAVEAGVMVRRGAGFVVKTEQDTLNQATALLSDEADRLRRGRIASEVVLNQRGATEKSLALLSPYL